MYGTEKSVYRPSFLEGSRVSLVKSGHSQNTRPAAVLRTLPNPSQRAEHQWYDVRFDSGVYGRFLERYLEPVDETG